MTTLPPLPVLKIDERLKRHDEEYLKRLDEERAVRLSRRKVVWALLHGLLENFPGEEITVECPYGSASDKVGRDAKEAMEAIFNLDKPVVKIGGKCVYLYHALGEDPIYFHNGDPRVEAAVKAAEEMLKD